MKYFYSIVFLSLFSWSYSWAGNGVMGFVENKGQISNSDILFVCSENNGNVYFLKDGITFVACKSARPGTLEPAVIEIMENSSLHRIDLIAKEFSTATTLVASERTYPVYYLVKDFSISSFAYKTLTYKNSITGSELIIEHEKGKGLQIEYIKGAAAPAHTDFILEGAETNLSGNNIKVVTGSGGLNLKISGDSFTSYQKVNAATTGFSPRENSLIWASFLGGSDIDEFQGVDANDTNLVIVGFTLSGNFPVTPGVIQEVKNLDYDVVITKFSTGGNILWSTYYGGSKIDFGYKCKMDLQGNIVVTGYSSSPDLPVSTGAFQTTFAGGYDGFILKLNPLGQINWATYYGGASTDAALALDIDNVNNILIGGYTVSANLPLAGASFQTSISGGRDAFVAKFSTTGAFLYATYFGGSDGEDGHAVAADKTGNFFIAGDTYSINLPVTSGAFQAFKSGSGDTYIAKFNSTGTLLWATYFGGSAFDDPAGLVTDDSLNLYVSGVTSSSDFPIESNFYLGSKPGSEAGFISKFNTDGNLIWSSFFGGVDNTKLSGLSLLEDKYLFAGGFTTSTDLPVSSNATQSSNAGLFDALICVFDTSGDFYYSSYFGGSGNDRAFDISVNSQREVFITGLTYSSDLPITGAFQPVYGIDGDGFIAGFDASNWVPQPITNTVSENAFSSSLALYPNPTTDYVSFNIPTSGNLCFSIFDFSGRMVLKGMALEKKLIDVSLLEQGKYTLELYNERNRYYAPLIKITR